MTKKETFFTILKYLRKYWYLETLVIVLALLTVASTLYVPIIIGDIIDVISNPELISNPEFFQDKVIMIIKLISVTLIVQWLLGIVNNFLTSNITYQLRLDVFKKTMHLPLRYLDQHQTGEIVSKAITDVDTFAEGLLMGFTEFFTGIMTIMGTLTLMLTINWIIAIIVVILTPISLFVAKFIATRIHDYFVKQSKVRAEETAFIDEMINNMKVVQAFAHEKESIKTFQEINERLEKCSLNAVFFSSLVNPTTRFINSVIYSVVALVGAIVIISSPYGLVLSVGELSCLLSYSREYSKPFNEISGVITELQNAFACASRVFELLKETEEIDDSQSLGLGSAKGDFVFCNVCFSYQINKPLIENLNLNVTKGMHVAIVGPTGCGKTTFINLIMRFYDPIKGTIYLDELDTQRITRASIRRNFGMVLQDTWLKSGTILENIKYGKPNATLEEVKEASKLTHADSFIKRLTKGYDTKISENGGNLSVGEKQLLCITRIMLMMPPLLILDEATSSIDTRTELKIQQAFKTLMKNKTSFIVAHRLSTIKNSDLILVMKNGKIVEQGLHQQLLQSRGFYYELYNSQFDK